MIISVYINNGEIPNRYLIEIEFIYSVSFSKYCPHYIVLRVPIRSKIKMSFSLGDAAEDPFVIDDRTLI